MFTKKTAVLFLALYLTILNFQSSSFARRTRNSAVVDVSLAGLEEYLFPDTAAGLEEILGRKLASGEKIEDLLSGIKAYERVKWGVEVAARLVIAGLNPYRELVMPILNDSSPLDIVDRDIRAYLNSKEEFKNRSPKLFDAVEIALYYDYLSEEISGLTDKLSYQRYRWFALSGISGDLFKDLVTVFVKNFFRSRDEEEHLLKQIMSFKDSREKLGMALELSLLGYWPDERLLQLVLENNPEDINAFLTPERLASCFRVISLNFDDSGGSITNFASMFTSLLTRIKPISLFPNIVIPKFSEETIDVGAIEGLLETAGMKDAEFVMLEGRNLIYKKDGRYLVIKLMKGEGDFIREVEVQTAMRNSKDIRLGSLLPKPVVMDDKVLFTFAADSVPGQIRDWLNEVSLAHEAIGRQFKIEPDSQGRYRAVAYIVESENTDYFTYLNNPEIGDEEFLVAAKKNIRDLMVLARNGLFHAALVDLFHASHDARDDDGKFLWMSEIVNGIIEGYGPGRLYAWQEAVKYPNPRLSSLADWEHIYSLNDIMADSEGSSVTPFLSPLSDFSDKAVNFYVASELGDYFLAMSLLVADRMYKRDELDWKNPEKLAYFIKEIFMEGYRTFTDNDGTDIEKVINWQRIATQIAFWCSYAYIPFVAPETVDRADNFPTEIFGSGVEIIFGDYREHNWRPDIGWSNKYEQRHLGGSFFAPQELLKSLFILSSFMITEVASVNPKAN